MVGERGEYMPGFGGFNEKKKKKKGQNQTSNSQTSFGSSRPEYTMPTVIKPVRKEK